MKKTFKKAAAILLVLVMVLGTFSVQVFAEKQLTSVDTTDRTSDTYDGTPDTSWYNETDTTFTLTTAEQFMGIASLVNVGTTTFSGKTIKLDADMIINTGDASTWTASTTGLYAYTPIGNSTGGTVKFEGTFDGQGHYISGVFSVVARDNGLFYYCHGATLKNFSLINSAFLNTGSGASNSQCAGSVCGRLYDGSVIDSVYSNAYVKAGYGAGGLVAYFGVSDATYDACVIRNSVYEGTVDGTEAANAVGGIVAIDDKNKKACSVEDCIFAGKLYGATGADNNTSTAGWSGIVGRWAKTTISNCISAGTLEVASERSAAKYSPITYSWTANAVTADIVKNCYVDSSKVPAAATAEFVGNTSATFSDCASLTTGNFTAANLPALDFTSTWTAIDGDYPVPTGVWSFYKEYYAKSIQNVGVQDTFTEGDASYSLRFVAQIDSLNYENAGFEITLSGNSAKDIEVTTAYKSILTTGIDGTVDAKLGTYFVCAVITDIPTSAGEVSFTVKPYVVNGSGKVYSESWTVTYNAGIPQS